MSGGGASVTYPATVLGHRVGTGPDSIYVHAVAPKAVAGGPVALCGYPLREVTVHGPAAAASGLAAAETFEALARTSGDCCPECREALALVADEADPAAAPSRARPWAQWVAISVAAVASLGALIGVAIVAAQRF